MRYIWWNTFWSDIPRALRLDNILKAGMMGEHFVRREANPIDHLYGNCARSWCGWFRCHKTREGCGRLLGKKLFLFLLMEFDVCFSKNFTTGHPSKSESAQDGEPNGGIKKFEKELKRRDQRCWGRPLDFGGLGRNKLLEICCRTMINQNCYF